MPVDVLRCRVCESEYPAEANGICARCFGPLEPVYDWDEIARAVTRESDRGRAALALALQRAAAGRAAGGRRRAARASRRSCRRRGSRARSAWARSGSSSTSRTRRTRSRTASSRSRPRRRASSGSRRSSATSTGNLANAVAARAAADRHARGHLLPGRARAREARGDDGLRRDGLRRARDATTTARASSASSPCEVDWGIVNVNLRSYYAEGSKTLAFEICRAARLGDARRRRRCRSAPARCSPRSGSGFQQFERLGLDRAARSRSSTAARPRAARPVASAFAEDRRVTPVRPRHGRVVDRDRQPGRRRPRDREGARVGRRGATRCPRTRSARTSRCSPSTSGIFGEGATGVAIGALREAVRARRARRERPRRRARHRHRPEDAAALPRRAAAIVEIDADVDAVLEELGVTA